jgi:hypothetical protein
MMREAVEHIHAEIHRPEEDHHIDHTPPPRRMREADPARLPQHQAVLQAAKQQNEA